MMNITPGGKDLQQLKSVTRPRYLGHVGPLAPSHAKEVRQPLFGEGAICPAPGRALPVFAFVIAPALPPPIVTQPVRFSRLETLFETFCDAKEARSSTGLSEKCFSTWAATVSSETPIGKTFWHTGHVFVSFSPLTVFRFLLGTNARSGLLRVRSIDAACPSNAFFLETVFEGRARLTPAFCRAGAVALRLAVLELLSELALLLLPPIS